MSAASVPVGNQIESNSRTIAHSIPISRLQLQTVVELLDAVQEHAPHLPVSMLRTTATHLADCLKVPIERLKIADLERVGPEFRQYLEERRFKRNSVRSYSNFLHILLQTAKNLGCQFNEFDVPEPWKEIMGRLAKCHKGYTGPFQIAIRYGKGPSEFSEKDLSDWREEALHRGCCYGYVRSFAACFRLALLRLELADRFPLLSCGRQRQDTHYSVPIDNFPAPLRDEVQLLLRWKQDPYAEGRPRRGRHRAVTAKGLERCIARLYGFVTKVEKRTGIASLGQLVRKESVVAFLRWLLNERKVRSTGVARLCINNLQSARARREEYVGEWLPEPIVTDIGSDPFGMMKIDESLSMAFLVLLERLTPVERAVLLLREVFEYEYSEIASVLNLTQANCRQILRRARLHVSVMRPRFQAPKRMQSELLQRFLEAVGTGEMEGLISLLANDVALHSDGGGKAVAVPNVVYGANKVARGIIGALKRLLPKDMVRRTTSINGKIGLINYHNGKPHSVLTFDAVGDKIQAIYIITNPEKLSHIPDLDLGVCRE